MSSSQFNHVTTEGESRVEMRDGCTLIFGALLSNQVNALSRDGSVDDVMSPELAALFGATFA